MTGLKGNSEFCFPETLNVPQGEVFCYTSQLKNRKNCEEIVCLTQAGSQIAAVSMSTICTSMSRKFKLFFLF